MKLIHFLKFVTTAWQALQLRDLMDFFPYWKRFSCIPATSVAAERVFSSTGLFMDTQGKIQGLNLVWFSVCRMYQRTNLNMTAPQFSINHWLLCYSITLYCCKLRLTHCCDVRNIYGLRVGLDYSIFSWFWDWGLCLEPCDFGLEPRGLGILIMLITWPITHFVTNFLWLTLVMSREK